MFGVITRSEKSDFDILSGSVNIFSKTACNVGIIDEFSLREYEEVAKNIFCCDFVEKSITLQQKEYKTSKQNKRMSY